MIALIEIDCFTDLSYNIDGNIFKAIKSLYKDTVCTVKINDYITEYFHVLYGVKQGDNLSPTLFNLFINNLDSQIKELHCGIKVGIEQHIRIFAVIVRYLIYLYFIMYCIDCCDCEILDLSICV